MSLTVCTGGILTDGFGGGQANIFIGTVEEGEAGLSSCRHQNLLFDHRVYPHFTERVRRHFLKKQRYSFLLGEIHGADN